jgi:hypothetical protein|tara:strand:- start:12564 stop:13598 length:1035 start_codon:yes stop_codon:yes gene_type:complete
MADPLLDFNRDIAPVRDNYGLTAPETAFLNAKADQQVLPQLDLMVKLRGQIQKEKAADLAYETSVFEFKQRKKGIREKRDFDERAEELTQNFTDIMNNPDLDPNEKMVQLSQFQLNNSSVIANSDVARSSVSAALQSISAQMQKRNEEKAKKEKKKNLERAKLDSAASRDYNLVREFTTQDQINDLREVYRASGEGIDPVEESNLKAAEIAVKRYDEKQQKEEDAKELSRLEREQKQRIDLIDTDVQILGNQIRDFEAEQKVFADLKVSDAALAGNMLESIQAGFTLPDGRVIKPNSYAELISKLRQEQLNALSRKRIELGAADPNAPEIDTTAGSSAVPKPEK